MIRLKRGRNKSKSRSTDVRKFFVERVAPRTTGAIFLIFWSIQHAASIYVAQTVVSLHFRRSRWSKRHVQAPRNGLRHFLTPRSHDMIFCIFKMARYQVRNRLRKRFKRYPRSASNRLLPHCEAITLPRLDYR